MLPSLLTFPLDTFENWKLRYEDWGRGERGGRFSTASALPLEKLFLRAYITLELSRGCLFLRFPQAFLFHSRNFRDLRVKNGFPHFSPSTTRSRKTRSALPTRNGTWKGGARASPQNALGGTLSLVSIRTDASLSETLPPFLPTSLPSSLPPHSLSFPLPPVVQGPERFLPHLQSDTALSP